MKYYQKMGAKSGIEWTDSSWNPVTGCTKVSAGCAFCYAERLAKRLQMMNPNGKYKNGFKLTLHEKDIELPLSWKEPRTIFVNSMSDLFHEQVPFSFIKRVFDTMEKANGHTFQILTKRPHLMRQFVNDYYKKVLPNVWLGTSIENDKVLYRLGELKKVNATIRFISFEPLIGPVGKVNLRGIHWAIVGGESGKYHRLIKKEWIYEIRRQCKKYGTAFFFKQWGGLTSKSGGRTLDNRTYDEYPNVKLIIPKITNYR